MELRVATPERLTFARRGVVASGLVAVPLVALGLLPLTSEITLSRVLTAAALLLTAAVCAKLELPGSHRVEVSLKTGQLRRRGRVVPLDAARAWILATGGCGSAGRYEILLELRDGSTWPVLTGSDPGALLEQLARALARLDLPVRPGWGLPDDARPWEAWQGPARDSSWLPPETRPVVWPVQPDQHRIAWALGVGATLVALILAVIGAARAAKGEPTAGLSAALAVGLVVLLLAITLAVAIDRVTLTLRPRLAIRHRRFGFWTVSQVELSDTQWRRGYLVEAGAERHLLLETETGPRAFPCQPTLPLPELQAVLARGPNGPGAGDPSARRAEAQHARLAL